MATLVIRHPDGTEHEEPLKGELVIGRAPDCGLVLAEGGVSRKHARLSVQGRAVMVEDLGSSNGTFIDGVPVSGPTRWPPSGTLTIGDWKLSLRGGAQPVRPSSLARPPPAEALAVRPRSRVPPGSVPAGDGMRWVLKGTVGVWVGQSYPLSGRMLVGRVPPATILVDDSSVSRRHAELEVRGAQVLVRDVQSANGTRVNGEPVATERVLKEGDWLEFGVVEFTLELRTPTGTLALPTESGLSPKRAVGLTRRGVDARRNAGRRMVFVVGAVVVSVLLLVAGLLKVLKVDAGSSKQPVDPMQDLRARTEHILSECRTFADVDRAQGPDWTRAEKACNQVLKLDPINSSAVELLKRIEQEQKAQKHFQSAERQLQLFNPELSLEEFAKIPEQSHYYVVAKPNVLEAIDAVKKKAGEDCKRYLRDNLVQVAYPRCELYVRYACQDMRPEELRPPMGERLNLSRGRLRAHEWRPADPLYLSFLRLREKVEPAAAPWSCPTLAIGRKGPRAEPPENFVRRAVEVRYPERTLALAVLNYWSGRAEEAIAVLQRFRNDNRKAALHAKSDELQKTISIALSLFQKGEGEVHKNNLELAADSFDEVLKQDELLLADEAQKRPSFFRRNIQEDMAHATYQLGKNWADREDMAHACRLYQLGFRYSRENSDLITALTRCSEIASERLKVAQGCDELDAALRFATNGDGVKERAQERKSQLRCP